MAKFWATEVAENIIKKHGKKLTVATGISPSGPIHIGNMREVLTADFVVRELRKQGAEVRFIYIEDNFDRLRKLYPYLPKSFEKYIGWPLVKIPDPVGDCHKSYAQHFIDPFFKVIDKLGIQVEKFSAYKMYDDGFYTDHIVKSFKRKKEIIKILEEVSQRKIADDWSPYNPLCEKCGKIDEAKVTRVDLENHKVDYKCSCGHIGSADFSRAEGKLVWRVDWPARWNKFPVSVEPFGKEHATVGGSYDTGKEICEKIFQSQAPFPIPYDLVYLRGFKGGKMSSSLGNVISADEFLQVVPPEIMRYMFARVKYNKPFYFDMGTGLIQLVDEFNALTDKYKKNDATEEEKAIYETCHITSNNGKHIQIPFKHLMTTIQAAQGNQEEIKRILERTGYKTDKTISEQVERGKLWLEKYAPENFKFQIQEKVPNVKLNELQIKLLHQLATDLENKSWEAEDFHNYIYNQGKSLGLKPKETFESVYLALLGKSSGPKAGWFVLLLDKDFVVKRFNEIK